MKALDFNENWRWRKMGETEWKPTHLPHDALIFEDRKKDAESGVHLGWFT